MVVDGEVEMSVNSSVHQADQVRCARYKVSLEARTHAAIIVRVRSVDQTVVQSWWSLSLCISVLRICSLVIPIVQEENTKVFIVIGGSGPMNENATEDAVPSLERVV